MNTIHHFGDSYACYLRDVFYENNVENFVEIFSKQLNYKYTNKAHGGESNEMILDRLINHLNEFKNGDILFINFSFFSRGCWYDEKYQKIKSTNALYDDLNDFKQYYFAKNKHVIDLVEYYLNHTIDYNKRIFKLINSVLKNIQSKGICVFYIFIETKEWSDELIDNGTSIEFPNGFGKWLQKNNFHKEEEGHYTRGIQPVLANAILKKTNCFKEQSKTIFIDIDDMDFGVKLKKPNKINLL